MERGGVDIGSLVSDLATEFGVSEGAVRPLVLHWLGVANRQVELGRCRELFPSELVALVFGTLGVLKSVVVAIK